MQKRPIKSKFAHEDTIISNMENLQLGFLLMLVGMVTVFIILLIVIYGSQALISLINKIAPAEPVKVVKSGQEDLNPVFEAPVGQITGGKGRLVKVTKI